MPYGDAVMSITPENGLPSSRMTLMVRKITYEAFGICSYELVDPSGASLPPASAGSHIDVYLDDGTSRQYSLCNDPADQHRYVIAVLREEWGRGGSKKIHDAFRVKQEIEVGLPRNNFALSPDASRHILIAGGIGVTPLKAMAHQLNAAGMDYEFHYCAKSPRHAAFITEMLQELDPKKVRFHFDGGNPVDGLDISSLLSEQAPGSHVYFCGPPGFMAACQSAAAHWQSGTVHSEHFKAPAPSRLAHDTGTPVSDDREFSVQIASTGLIFGIPANRSIAQVLADAAIQVETSCEAGLCGACKVNYLEGDVDHRDFILSEEEKKQCLTTCVSRAKSAILVLNL